jgi:gliding motility-associated-like protein
MNFEAAYVFTPNGDGINDKFVIKNIDAYPDNKLMVYDRLGKPIYVANSYANNWDGKVNGFTLAKDTYFYVLSVKGQVVKRGAITLVR